MFLGPVLAQLSRVLATRDPLFSAATWRSLPSWRRVDARLVACAGLNGVLFGLAAWRWDSPLEGSVFAAFFSVLVIVCVIDVLHARIPDRISFPAMAVGAGLVGAATAWQRDPVRLGAVVLAAALFWGVLGVAHLISPRGMGRGDVKLGVVLGIALGWVAPGPLAAVTAVFSAFFLASLVGTAIGLVLWAYRRHNAPYPFGPALVLAVVAVLLASPGLLGG